MLDAGPDVLAWLREADGERWLVALNMSLRDQATAISLPDHATGVGRGSWSSRPTPDRAEGPVGLADLRLGMDEGVLIRLDDEEERG